jgi:hypothetical protein
MVAELEAQDRNGVKEVGSLPPGSIGYERRRAGHSSNMQLEWLLPRS